MLIPCLQTFIGHEASHQASVVADRRLGLHPAGNHRTGSAIPAGHTVHSSRNDYSLFAVHLGQIPVGKTPEAFSETSRCGRPVCCQGCHRVETIFSRSRNCPLKLASKRIEAASHFSQWREWEPSSLLVDESSKSPPSCKERGRNGHQTGELKLS